MAPIMSSHFSRRLVMTSKRAARPVAMILFAWCSLGSGMWAAEQGPINLAPALVFHASFDGTCDANVSPGDGRIYTAETLTREKVREGNHRTDVSIARGAGRHGDALRFAGV